MTQDEYNEAVLERTSGPNWDIVVKGLKNDIYHTQAMAFDAKDWGAVCELKGFARGLAYCMNLRNVVITSIEQAKANANL